jgi:hypothetical protein
MGSRDYKRPFVLLFPSRGQRLRKRGMFLVARAQGNQGCLTQLGYEKAQMRCERVVPPCKLPANLSRSLFGNKTTARVICPIVPLQVGSLDQWLPSLEPGICGVFVRVCVDPLPWAPPWLFGVWSGTCAPHHTYNKPPISRCSSSCYRTVREKSRPHRDWIKTPLRKA